MSRRDDKGSSSGGGGAPTWMLTYADTITLLMTFFVLLMTFASIDKKKFQALAGALQEMLGPHARGNVGSSRMSPSPLRSGQDSAHGVETPPDYDEMESVKKSIRKCLRSTDLDEVVDFTQTERGLLLRLQPQMLFEQGAAQIKAESAAVLSIVANTLKKVPHRLRVFGHGDEFFMPTRRHPHNPALAMARASAVCHHLAGRGGIKRSRLQAASPAGELHTKSAAIEIMILQPQKSGLQL